MPLRTMIKAYYNEFDPKCAAWLRQLIKNGNITPGVVDERSITEVRPEDLVGFDRVHFFAGIGTWDYCLSQAEWGDRPIWTASLPCQPFSAAGRRLGKADDRHLLPHFLELVKECRPETIFGEQVASSEVVGSELEASFIIAVQQGEFAKANKLAKRLVAQKSFTFSSRWIDDLYAEMEAEGYAVRHSVLGAHSVGSFHIRQRLYWVANSNKQRLQGRTRAERTDQQFVGKNGVVDGLANSSNGGLQPKQDKQSAGVFGTSLQPKKQREQPSHLCAASYGLGIAEGERFGEARQLGSRSEERLADAGADIEWIYCRDNKYRPVKPGIFKMAHGITAGMVCCCHTSIERNEYSEEEKVNGTEHKTNAGEILPSMQQEDGKEENQCKAGRFSSIQKTEILRSTVHGKWIRGSYESPEFKERPQAVSEESEGLLRGVFKDNHASCSSCGRKSFEQQAIEFNDIVRHMPQGSTFAQLLGSEGAQYMQTLRKTSNEDRPLLDAQHPAKEVWESLNDEEKDRIGIHFNNRAWVMDEAINPLVDKLHSGDPGAPIDANATQEARAMRLKGYGNAIQAQTAIAFISAFMSV